MILIEHLRQTVPTLPENSPLWHDTKPGVLVLPMADHRNETPAYHASLQIRLSNEFDYMGSAGMAVIHLDKEGSWREDIWMPEILFVESSYEFAETIRLKRVPSGVRVVPNLYDALSVLAPELCPQYNEPY